MLTWIKFCACVLLGIVALFGSGYCQLRLLRFARAAAFACAPLVSIFEASLFGVAFGLAGIPVSSWTIFGLLGIIAFIALFAFRRASVLWEEGSQFGACIKPVNLILFILVACITVGYYYILPLDGPASYVQLYDNAYHLNLITSFMVSGRYSFIQAVTGPSLPISALTDISFYPAAWHVVAALCGDAFGATAGYAENVANVIFLAFVWPSSMCIFASKLFEKAPKAVPYCAIALFAFANFPWQFLTLGPLYSNMASFVVLPAAMFVFLEMIQASEKRDAVVLGAVFIVSCLALVFCQPNAVFTGVVILLPACVVIAFCRLRKYRGIGMATAAAVLLVVAVCSVWMLARNLGMFTGVVGNAYEIYTTASQSALDFISFKGRSATEQYLPATLAIIGIVATWVKGQNRWLVFSYLFFGLAFVSAGGVEGGIFGTLLSGYWYNDVERVIASAVLVAIPLVGLGLYAVTSLFLLVWVRLVNGKVAFVPGLAIAIAFCAIVYPYQEGFAAVESEPDKPLSSQAARLEDVDRNDKSLPYDELVFLDEVEEVVGNTVLVINFPFDGSVYAYTENGINTMYKHYFASEDPSRVLIQEKLDEISWNTKVQEAASNIGAKYVLLLDVGHVDMNDGSASIYQQHLLLEKWEGLMAINDSTPGFKVILSEDDKRLYEIEGVA